MANEAFNRRNFHKHTFCVWQAYPLTVLSGLQPDYKSKSGSTYYFTTEGVYRYSDHWARVANCKWRLEGIAAHGFRLGYAKWKDFHPDNETEKLYFIKVDFNTKTATYEHRDSLSSGDATVFRNAPETMKRIRDIRKFLEQDQWLAYYNGDAEDIRKSMVSALIHTDKPVTAIRAEILAKI